MAGAEGEAYSTDAFLGRREEGGGGDGVEDGVDGRVERQHEHGHPGVDLRRHARPAQRRHAHHADGEPAEEVGQHDDRHAVSQGVVVPRLQCKTMLKSVSHISAWATILHVCLFVTRHSTDLVTTRLRARAYDSHKHPAVGDGDDAEGDEVDEDENDDGVVPAGGALRRQVQRQADARAAVEAPEVVEARQRHAGQQQA